MSPKALGMSPKALGMSPKSAGMSPRAWGMSPRALGMSPEAWGMSPKSAGTSHKSAGTYPGGIAYLILPGEKNPGIYFFLSKNLTTSARFYTKKPVFLYKTEKFFLKLMIS
jgi:hypothetical protein